MTNGPVLLGSPETTAILAPAGRPAPLASIHFMALAWAPVAPAARRADSVTSTKRRIRNPLCRPSREPLTISCGGNASRVVAPPSKQLELWEAARKGSRSDHLT